MWIFLATVKNVYVFVGDFIIFGRVDKAGSLKK